MKHKFNPENKKKLISEDRQKTLPARRILEDAGLKPGMSFADVGCGNGYFTFPASELVGSKGRFFALDILPELLEDIKIRAKEEVNNNIEVIKTQENNLKIKKESVDIAFSCNVVHEAKDLILFLKEISRILKPGGSIIIIDWEKAETELGPPKEHRIDKDVVINELINIGFKYLEAKGLNKDQYQITAIKN